jgi:sialate O-acetylesterase
MSLLAVTLLCLTIIPLSVDSALSLSNTLGDHMVLQRAPQQAVVFGFATSGVTVSTTFNGTTYKTTADTSGTWRQSLPATPAGGPYNLTFTSSDGGTASLSDVLFGDVYLAGGQSNMQFTLSLANNASDEIATADSYPKIRVFTVGQGTSSNTPLTNLATIEQGWSVGSKSSVGGPDWGYQTAVGWLFARNIYNALGGQVPIGLVNNNWGGTTIQQWSSSDAAAKCGQTGSGNLWNPMIVPYTVGPFTLKGVIWYQGESNVGQTDYYACAFPAMISDWRAKLNNPTMWFGFVQIAGYNYGAGPNPADLRQAQLSGLTLSNVGYATAVDVGTWNDIHPKDKQTVATRLSNSALTQVYGQTLPWQAPIYASATQTTSGTTITVTVSFQAGTVGSGLTTTVPAPALAAQANICVTGLTPDECGFPTIQVNDASSTTLNATATLSSDRQSIVLTATAPASGLKAISTSYGRASWAVTTFFNSNALPVIPWYKTL